MLRTKLLGLVLLAAAGTVVTGAPASAAAEQDTSLVLTVTEDYAEPATTQVFSLTCNPIGGQHQQPAQACRELEKVNGDFTKLEVAQTSGGCPFILWPITVTANGTWKGKPVSYRETFSNSCVLEYYTGPVFKR